VNNSGTVSPIDALIVINYVNGPSGGVLPPDPTPPATPLDIGHYYYDVDGKGSAGAADVLAIVNVLNSAAAMGGEGEAAAMTAAPSGAPRATANLSAGLLVIPDFTLLTRASGEAALVVPATSGKASAAVRRNESSPAAGENRRDACGNEQDAWFQRVGEESAELNDAAWSDALDDFAEAVDDGFGDWLAADVVLSGLKAKA
jgi:hypothetical protein